ncbi:MAG: family 16 glycoside hydrolase [Gemmataceae bacterium]
MAAKDDSAIVRREIASMLQRLPTVDRWSYLEGLLTHKNDSSDHNLPLLYWYALEPLAELDAARAMTLASNGPAPLANFMARKLGGIGTSDSIAAVIQQLQNPAVTRDILLGLKEGMAGKSKVEMPRGWQTAYTKLASSNDSEVRDIALSLATIFGDTQAYQQLLKVLEDPATNLPARQKALATLVSVKSKDLGSSLPEFIAAKNLDTALQGAMIRAMATFTEPGTAKALVDLWPMLGQASRRDALATLASRPEWAEAMLDAIGKKVIQPGEVPAELVRQLSSLGNKTLDKRIGDVWGLVRFTPAEKQKKIADLRKMINSQNQTPNLAHGRTLYLKACHQCHTLYGLGGKIGPDLTGSNRANLDYILENMVDPSAVIPKEYSMSTIALENGRVVTGIVKDETTTALTLQTANELVVLAKKDIESRKPSEISMMPDNLLQNLSGSEIRDLVGYLRNPTQTGFLASKENSNLFFNGKDLSGWHGDEKIWRLEKGEIIGSTTGLKRNTFLRSEMQVKDFRLEFLVKLAPDSGNSGVQFRSEPLPDGEMRGPQADIGKGWWGKLYEESGRGLLWKDSGEAHVKPMEWNHYKIEAIGAEIRTWINGKLCVDLKDEKVSRQGEIAFQVHSGPAVEVRFKDIRLEIVEASGK